MGLVFVLKGTQIFGVNKGVLIGKMADIHFALSRVLFPTMLPEVITAKPSQDFEINVFILRLPARSKISSLQRKFAVPSPSCLCFTPPKIIKVAVRKFVFALKARVSSVISF